MKVVCFSQGAVATFYSAVDKFVIT